MGFIAYDPAIGNYDDKSCSALEKAYYRPIEAALRWCGLAKLESQILDTLKDEPIPTSLHFPQWPCLRKNAEMIFDAIENGEMPHGRDGKPVANDDHVAKPRRTVRHTDLKVWMSKHFPDQKPEFLFGEIERTAHSAINADSFLALQADRNALKTRVEAAEKWFKENSTKLAEADAKINKLQAESASLSTKEKNTFLTIIAALCNYSDIKHQDRGAASQIATFTSDLGAEVTDDTIRKILKQIPDALRTRLK